MAVRSPALLPGSSGSLVGPRALATLAARLRRCSGVQAELARERLRALRRLRAEAGRLEQRISQGVAGHPPLEIPGVGALIAAKLLGEVGDVSRFRSDDAFAALAGVAPIPASSGQVQRMRLNRGGNRQLNRALYLAALVQLRHHPRAQAFVAQAGRGQELPQAKRTSSGAAPTKVSTTQRKLASPRRSFRGTPRFSEVATSGNPAWAAAWSLTWTLIDPVSCVSCVSWMCWL